MIKVLVTGAGGSPALNFVRSLREAGDYYLIGVDANMYSLCRAETDEKHLVPVASDENYIPVMKQIIAETEPDLVHPQHSREVPVIGKHRHELGARVFLPRQTAVNVCDDKMLSYDYWQAAGITVPETMMVFTHADIDRAFSVLGPKVWIRATSGSGGRGAITITDPHFAYYWIDEHKGWGNFSISEYLSPDSVVWQSIWDHGKLVVAQGRRRLYWEFGSKFLSGVSGMTGAGEIVSDPVVDQVAISSIKAIDACPGGVWGVDMTYNSEGIP